MKIFSIEVVTDVGRRVVKLNAPIVVDPAPQGEMPVPFRALTEALWGLVREVAVQAPEAPKAEA
jgi:hypothetical protein